MQLTQFIILLEEKTESNNNLITELEKLDAAEPYHVTLSSDINKVVGMLQNKAHTEPKDDKDIIYQQAEQTLAAILQAINTSRLAL